MEVPRKVVDAVALLAELGAEQVVCKTVADRGLVEELCDDEFTEEERWIMLQDDEEDWTALYCYKEGASEINAATPGAWFVRVQCDYKHYWVNVTAPATPAAVSYLFSIKNEEVMILDDTMKSAELNATCEKYVKREHTIRRICREDPNANECMLRLLM